MTDLFQKSIAQLDQIIAHVQSIDTNQNATQNSTNKNANQRRKPKTEKKPKTDKPSYSQDEDIARFQRSRIQVVQIVEAYPHPESDKLMIMKIEIGSNEPQRTLVAGIQQHYTAEQLVGRLVCAILNLRVAKLAGINSEAMILAGSAQIQSGFVVRLVDPPQNSQIGDRLFIPSTDSENVLPPSDRLNDKQWKKVVEQLHVGANSTACVGQHVIQTLRGPVSVNDLPQGSEIH